MVNDYQPGNLLYRDCDSGHAWVLLVELAEREIHGPGVFWTELQWRVQVAFERSGETFEDWLMPASLHKDWTRVGDEV